MTDGAAADFTRGRVTGRLLIGVVALTTLCMGLHELAHHVAARIVCGASARMTLTTFYAPRGCIRSDLLWVAVLAGPALTYALLLGSAALPARWGAILTVANLPLARLATAATGGDDAIVTRLWFGMPLHWAAVLAAMLILAWPLMRLYQVLPPGRRTMLLAFWLIVPLMTDMIVKRGLFAPLLPPEPAWQGVPVGVLIALGAAAALAVAALGRRGRHRRGIDD